MESDGAQLQAEWQVWHSGKKAGPRVGGGAQGSWGSVAGHWGPRGYYQGGADTPMSGWEFAGPLPFPVT